LTQREREVFDLMLLGRNAREIGTVLGITARTAKFHQSNLLQKLGADGRTDLLRLLM
jgi:DNA-binding CsgD family transcriptional regulator